MSTKIKIRRDLYDNWQSENPVLGDGEIGLIKDKNQLVFGNGVDRFLDLTPVDFGGNDNGWKLIRSATDEASFTVDIDNSKLYKIIFQTVNNNGTLYMTANGGNVGSGSYSYQRYTYGILYDGSQVLSHTLSYDYGFVVGIDSGRNGVCEAFFYPKLKMVRAHRILDYTTSGVSVFTETTKYKGSEDITFVEFSFNLNSSTVDFRLYEM